MTSNSGMSRWLSVWFLLFPFVTVGSCSFYCPAKIDVSLGEFNSMEIGSRASIKRLSEEIHRCSEVRKYRVAWRVDLGQQERGWHAVMYERQDRTTGRLGYEYDPESGFREPVYIVADEAVHDVARSGGGLEDFAKYRLGKN